MPVELVELLAKRFPESSRTTLREMIAAKRVVVDGETARTLKQLVPETATIDVLGRVEARQRVAPSPPFRVVFEDRDLLVIDKPAGVLTSSGEHDARSTAFDVLTDYYAAIDGKIELGLVHRLDKDASGLIVFSKNPVAFEALKAQFADKSAKRVYTAIVTGVPPHPQRRIESKLVELADGTVKSTRHRDYGDVAATRYKTIEKRGGHAMLRVELETGRKHQIRVHLAEAGTPIAGDVLYHPHPRQAPRLMLVAVELTLTHPRAKQAMTWTTELPRDAREWWDAQRNAVAR
jgi:23S rRNA pseudouridine1911/1915/1917 synthase